MLSEVNIRFNNRQFTVHASFKPSEIACNVTRISCLNSFMISRSVLPTNSKKIRFGNGMKRPSRLKYRGGLEQVIIICMSFIEAKESTTNTAKTLQPRGCHRPNRPSLISSGDTQGLIHFYGSDQTMQQNSRNRLLWLPVSTNTSYFVVFKQQISQQIFLSVQPPTAPIERGK